MGREISNLLVFFDFMPKKPFWGCKCMGLGEAEWDEWGIKILYYAASIPI